MVRMLPSLEGWGILPFELNKVIAGRTSGMHTRWFRRKQRGNIDDYRIISKVATFLGNTKNSQ
jgi:hypothetical protein